MRTLKVVVQAELDGIPIGGFPLVRRLAVDEAQSFTYEKPAGVGFTAVPADQLDTIQALILGADQVVLLRVDGQTDAGLEINPGGFVVLFDVRINAGAGAGNASLQNNGTAAALVAGLAAGS